jgi:RNA polymerase sigma-70 factor (ECF subfamily)
MELAALVEAHQITIRSAILATCRHWRVSGADAEDLAIDLWVCLLRDDARVLQRFEARSTMETYLFRVLNRAAGKWVRARTRRARVEVPWGDTYVTFDGDGSLAAKPTPPYHDELLPVLEEALGMLPERDRALLALRRDGLSNGEIAKVYGTSSNAVELRIRRVVARLRDAVGGGRQAAGRQERR